MNTIEKTFQVPSNGLFGGPKEITLRAMTTKEEKIIVTTKDFSVFERIVKSCCVEPKDLDTGLLHQNDIMYLIFALREITFGNSYEQEVICPECGLKQSIVVDIADMSVNMLDIEEVQNSLLIKLPMLGDTLQLKVLSLGDIKRIDKVIKQKVSQGKLQDPEGYEFLVKLMETVVSRNGEDFESFDEKKWYLDNMNMRDLIVLQNALSSVVFGLDTTIHRTCSRCGEDMEVRGLICPEFFRPSKYLS